MTEIPPPESLLAPLKVPTKLLMGPGPSNCPLSVLSAASQQMLGHLDEDFLKIMEDVKKGIQYAFQTSNRLTFAVSGTGHCAMETAIINLLEPGDIFLVASSGIWGDRAKNIAERIAESAPKSIWIIQLVFMDIHKVTALPVDDSDEEAESAPKSIWIIQLVFMDIHKVTALPVDDSDEEGVQCFKISCEANQPISLKTIEEVVERVKPNVTFICHGDSSTGVLQPLNGIGDMLKRHGCLLLVDAVASLGAAPLFMDKLGIDVLYSGSQKILNAPPGISPISFSSKAVAKVKGRKTPVPSFYMDSLLIGNYWNCDDGPIIYHHTAPINLVYALREALSCLVKETLEKSWEKHKIYAEVMHNQLEHKHLKLFVSQKEYRLPSVTSVVIPEHINGARVVQRMKERYNIDIAGGLGSTSGKVWRIGLMGYNCNAKNISETVDALLDCIRSATFKSNL